MVEVFKYTERVVNMIRPRKLLLMAIGGALPISSGTRCLPC
jgi:5'-3' exoribonuclease 2